MTKRVEAGLPRQDAASLPHCLGTHWAAETGEGVQPLAGLTSVRQNCTYFACAVLTRLSQRRHQACRHSLVFSTAVHLAHNTLNKRRRGRVGSLVQNGVWHNLFQTKHLVSNALLSRRRRRLSQAPSVAQVGTLGKRDDACIALGARGSALCHHLTAGDARADSKENESITI